MLMLCRFYLYLSVRHELIEINMMMNFMVFDYLPYEVYKR